MRHDSLSPFCRSAATAMSRHRRRFHLHKRCKPRFSSLAMSRRIRCRRLVVAAGRAGRRVSAAVIALLLLFPPAASAENALDRVGGYLAQPIPSSEGPTNLPSVALDTVANFSDAGAWAVIHVDGGARLVWAKYTAVDRVANELLGVTIFASSGAASGAFVEAVQEPTFVGAATTDTRVVQWHPADAYRPLGLPSADVESVAGFSPEDGLASLVYPNGSREIFYYRLAKSASSPPSLIDVIFLAQTLDTQRIGDVVAAGTVIEAINPAAVQLHSGSDYGNETLEEAAVAKPNLSVDPSSSVYPGGTATVTWNFGPCPFWREASYLVEFTVSGANPGGAVVEIGGDGVAAWTYQGIVPGRDDIRARVVATAGGCGANRYSVAGVTHDWLPTPDNIIAGGSEVHVVKSGGEPKAGVIAIECDAQAPNATHITITSCTAATGSAPEVSVPGSVVATSASFITSVPPPYEVCWTAVASFETGSTTTSGCSG